MARRRFGPDSGRDLCHASAVPAQADTDTPDKPDGCFAGLGWRGLPTGSVTPGAEAMYHDVGVSGEFDGVGTMGRAVGSNLSHRFRAKAADVKTRAGDDVTLIRFGQKARERS